MVGAEGACHHCFFWGETLEKWQREEGRGGDVCEPWETYRLLSLSTQAWSGLLLSASLWQSSHCLNPKGFIIIFIIIPQQLPLEALLCFEWDARRLTGCSLKFCRYFMSGQGSFQAFCPHFQDLWLYFSVLHWGSVPGKAAPQGIKPKHLFLQCVRASVSVGFPPGQANSTSCSSSSRSCALLSNILHLPGVIDRFGNCTDGEQLLLCKYKGGFILQIILVHHIQLSAMIPLDDFPGTAQNWYRVLQVVQGLCCCRHLTLCYESLYCLCWGWFSLLSWQECGWSKSSVPCSARGSDFFFFFISNNPPIGLWFVWTIIFRCG